MRTASRGRAGPRIIPQGTGLRRRTAWRRHNQSRDRLGGRSAMRRSPRLGAVSSSATSAPGCRSSGADLLRYQGGVEPEQRELPDVHDVESLWVPETRHHVRPVCSLRWLWSRQEFRTCSNLRGSNRTCSGSTCLPRPSREGTAGQKRCPTLWHPQARSSVVDSPPTSRSSLGGAQIPLRWGARATCRG
jgi:hypothetical protein